MKYELILYMLDAEDVIVNNNVSWTFGQLSEYFNYNQMYGNSAGKLSLGDSEIVISSEHTIKESGSVYFIEIRTADRSKDAYVLLEFALRSKCKECDLFSGEALHITKWYILNNPGSAEKVGAIIYGINTSRMGASGIKSTHIFMLMSCLKPTRMRL